MEDQRMCRLCLSRAQDGFLVEIFSSLSLINEPGQQSLSEKIRALFGLKIYPNDGLPSMVCHKCLVLTENCMEFRDKCLKNDEKLRLIFKVNESATDESVEPVLDNSGEVEMAEEEEAEIITLNPNKLYESSDESEDESPEQMQLQTLAQQPEVTTIVKERTPPRPVQMNDNNKREIYHCRYCDVVFSDSLACSSHEQSNHDRMQPFKCIMCSYKTDQHPTLIFHIKQAHNMDKPFLCTQCSKTFMRRSDLRKHVFVHAGIRLYSCDICKKSFTRNTNLTKHKRTHFPNSQISEKTKNWKCQLCPRAFFSNADLLLHMEIHLDQKALICKHCNQAFQRRDQLEIHQKTHFEKNSFLQVEMMDVQHHLTAPVQPQPIVFYNQPPEQPTMNFYTENKTYNAPTNGGHMDYQQNQPYASLQPKKDYPIMNQLLAGINMNAMLQPMKNFICGICTSAFSKKKELDRHVMTVHTTIKQFKCGQCSKTFNRKDKLIRHEKIHSAPPPVYNCNLCEAVFLRKQMLDQHSKSHMMENGDNPMASLQPLMPDINGFASAYNSDAMQHRMSEIMQPSVPDPPATLYPMNLSFDRSLNEPMNLSNDKFQSAAMMMKIEPTPKPAIISDDEADELQIVEDLPTIKSEMFQSAMDAHRQYEMEANLGSFNPDTMMQHEQFNASPEVSREVERYEPSSLNPNSMLQQEQFNENSGNFNPDSMIHHEQFSNATLEVSRDVERFEPSSLNPQYMMQHEQFNGAPQEAERFEVERRFESSPVPSAELEVDERLESPPVLETQPGIENVPVQEEIQETTQDALQDQRTEEPVHDEPEIHGKFKAELTPTHEFDMQTRHDEDFVGNTEPVVAPLATDSYAHPEPPLPAPELKPNYEDLIKRVDDVAFPMTSRIGELEKLESLPPMEILNND